MADDNDVQDSGNEGEQDSPPAQEQDVQRPDEQDNIVKNSFDQTERRPPKTRDESED